MGGRHGISTQTKRRGRSSGVISATVLTFATWQYPTVAWLEAWITRWALGMRTERRDIVRDIHLWGIRLIVVVAGAFRRLEIVVAIRSVVMALQLWIEVKKPARVSWVVQLFACLLEE